METKADVVHTHSITQIDGIDEIMITKADVEHTHSHNDVTDWDVQMDSKANVEHTHAISDVNGLQEALDSKLEIADGNLTIDGTIDATAIGPNLLKAIDDSGIGPNMMNVIVGMLYPVGCIYTSMSPTSPDTLFGGSWTPIVDRFLWCTSGSLETGGSATITINNLPSHNHVVQSIIYPSNTLGNPDGATDSSSSSETYENRRYWRGVGSASYTTTSTGNNVAYYPPYMTCYAWYRTA